MLTPCVGAVGIVRTAGGCGGIKILSVSVDGEQLNAIVTGVTLEMSGNYQFLHTLNDLVYFYSFGDRVGSLIVTGIGFTNYALCGGTNGLVDRGPILKVYDYYQQKKAVKSGGKAMSVVLESGDGQTVKLWGFLTGMRIDVTDSQMGAIGYWTMRFEVLPQK